MQGLKYCLLVLCLVSLVLGETKYKVADVANPIEDPSGCGNTEPSLVCNPDSVLTKEEVTQINQTLWDIISESPCLCIDCAKDRDGTVPSLLVVKAIDGPQDTAENVMATMKSFAGDLRTQWNLADCGNDMTILVVTDRKFLEATFEKVWTSTGAMVKIPLSDQCVAAISKEDKPLFTDNTKIAEAIQSLLGKYKASLKKASCSIPIYNTDNEDKKDNNNNSTSGDSNNNNGGAKDYPAIFKHQEMILIIVAVVVVILFFVTCLGVICYVNKRQVKKRRKSYQAANRSEEL